MCQTKDVFGEAIQNPRFVGFDIFMDISKAIIELDTSCAFVIKRLIDFELQIHKWSLY